MKTADVLRTIEALIEAGDALASGQASIPAQIQMANECRVCAANLRAAIREQLPEMKVAA